jgi:hypothetical protein
MTKVLSPSSSFTACSKLKALHGGKPTHLTLCLDSNILMWLKAIQLYGRKSTEVRSSCSQWMDNPPNLSLAIFILLEIGLKKFQHILAVTDISGPVYQDTQNDLPSGRVVV